MIHLIPELPRVVLDLGVRRFGASETDVAQPEDCHGTMRVILVKFLDGDTKSFLGDAPKKPLFDRGLQVLGCDWLGCLPQTPHRFGVCLGVRPARDLFDRGHGLVHVFEVEPLSNAVLQPLEAINQAQSIGRSGGVIGPVEEHADVLPEFLVGGLSWEILAEDLDDFLIDRPAVARSRCLDAVAEIGRQPQAKVGIISSHDAPMPHIALDNNAAPCAIRQ